MSGSEPLANSIPDGAVVVGTDGSDTADRAVAWAARYAALEKRPLIIAHAFVIDHAYGPVGVPGALGMQFDTGATFNLVYEQLRADAEAVADAAKQKAAESDPSLETIAVVEHGDPRQLLLGLAETLTATYGSLQWATVIFYVTILVVLLLRPEGLFGTKLREDVAT